MSMLREMTPPRRGRPPARNEILRSGRLGGLEPEDLATRFGTPLYVYDLDVVTRQLEALRAVLPPVFDIAYAVKANPALAVIAHLGGHGLGADVASAGELASVVKAGIAASSVVFTGPGKRDDELLHAVRAGVRAITVESAGELARLEAIAERTERVVPVLLRVSAGEAAGLERVRLVGDDGSGKFGMDRRDLIEVARRAVASPRLELLGLHAFGASNLLDAGALAEHVRWTVAAAAELSRQAGFPLRLVDVGGGLGIAYDPHEDGLDLVGLGVRLAEQAEAWAADPWTRDMRILLEPGRFLVGPAGAYLARVVDRKTVGRETVIVLDGGIHHLIRPALTGQEHRVRALGHGVNRERAWPVTVAGPLCSGLDVFTRHAILAPPDVGELVAVLDAGAYGYTESMPFFLSHPVPAEVAIYGRRAELIRPRMEPAEWLSRQRLPDWSRGDDRN